jgi:hypothetical protein
MKAFLIFCAFIFAIMCGIACMSSSIQHNRVAIQKLNVEKVDTTKDEFKLLQNGYSWEDQEIDGMQYRVFFARPAGAYASKAIFAINVTKDKLEVDTLKSNLNIP